MLVLPLNSFPRLKPQVLVVLPPCENENLDKGQVIIEVSRHLNDHLRSRELMEFDRCDQESS